MLVAIATQPALASPTPHPQQTAVPAETDGPGSAEAADVTGDTVSTPAGEVDLRRVLVRMQLVEMGRSPADAAASAALLTEADLDVLVANPDMMQEAGMSTFWVIVIGVALIAGVIAIAAAGNGSISVF